VDFSFKHFTPLHVLEVVPEPVKKFVPGLQVKDEKKDVTFFMYTILQHEDMNKAIFFAEKNIIPSLKEHKISNYLNLQPTQIVSWIKALHGCVAQSLAKADSTDIKVDGEYAPYTVTEWKMGPSMYHDFGTAHVYNMSIENVFEKYKLSHLTQEFLTIFNKVRTDPTIIENEKNRPYSKAIKVSALEFYQNQPGDTENHLSIYKKISGFERLVHKVIDAVHQNKLTESELKTLNKVFSIYSAPEDISRKMDDFSIDLVEKLRECDGTTKAVVSVATWAFRQIHQISPFFNGNARTASLLMNCILASYNLPCILLERPADRKLKISEYKIAINSINSMPEIFEHYVYKLITQAINHPIIPIDDLDSATFEIIKIQIKLAKTYEEKLALGLNYLDLQLLYEIEILNHEQSKDKDLEKIAELTFDKGLHFSYKTEEDEEKEFNPEEIKIEIKQEKKSLDFTKRI
jgi:hypothetical protein